MFLLGQKYQVSMIQLLSRDVLIANKLDGIEPKPPLQSNLSSEVWFSIRVQLLSSHMPKQTERKPQHPIVLEHNQRVKASLPLYHLDHFILFFIFFLLFLLGVGETK